ncbi:hypothetical protein GMDG_07625 [Pseudogymnoascus destructans 20631-21]|uniref:Uncharacterized protein n=1 Tax=Pseudogymnoascus destructans (strain ATCC MYA-4855 / 20631-21) TaxID=658429 RepID=L8FYA4_PSED2|nr:hypothetical protein GMDG_07625 [Pseudogymnoascus destructans 20631-21]
MADTLRPRPIKFRLFRQPTATDLVIIKTVAFPDILIFPDPESTPLDGLDTDILLLSAGSEIGASVTAGLRRDALPAFVDAYIVGVPCKVVLLAFVLPEPLHEVEGSLVVWTSALATATSDGYFAHIRATADIDIDDTSRHNASRLGVWSLIDR